MNEDRCYQLFTSVCLFSVCDCSSTLSFTPTASFHTLLWLNQTTLCSPLTSASSHVNTHRHPITHAPLSLSPIHCSSLHTDTFSGETFSSVTTANHISATQEPWANRAPSLVHQRPIGELGVRLVFPWAAFIIVSDEAALLFHWASVTERSKRRAFH